jgi:hypothetical protein
MASSILRATNLGLSPKEKPIGGFAPPMTRVTLDSRIDTQPTSNPGAAGLINTNFIRVDSRARPW